MSNKIDRAIEVLKKGGFVLVFDAEGREEETDFVIAAEYIKPEHIRQMRKDGGGLICMAMDYNTWNKGGLPYLTDVLSAASGKYPVISKMVPNDIPYDAKSSFGLTINHRKTFTGITDNDRALTVRRFAEIATDDINIDILGKEFRAPGHIHLLNASKDLLVNRQGHTELSVALVKMAGLTPISAICEMMGDDGNSLSKSEAMKYAEEKGIPHLEGKEIIERWKEWSE